MKRYWDGVTPEMMTEEETGEEGNYIQHRPSWRVMNFNKLNDLLDTQQEEIKSLTRPRQLGSPSTSLPRSCAKKWMLAEQPVQQEAELQPVEDETICELLAEL